MRCLSVLLVALALVGVGCKEKPAEDVTPLPLVENTRSAPVAATPSPAIVSPHLRRTPASASTDSDLSRPPRSPGGGGGEWWKPRPAAEPSAREVSAFRERLQREMANVDSDDAPCDQVFDVMRAAATASEEPGQRELPSRAELRRRCGELPDEVEECMSPDYFRAHVTECNRAITRMAQRGERMMAEAREREEANR